MKRASKFLSLLLVLAMVCSLFVPAMAAEEEADLTGSVVILHTNDVHGAIDSYAKVAALKATYEKMGAYVLLVDAGDFIQGEPTVSVSEGATAVELMNMAGYDLAAPGNHEFDYGYENLKALSEQADFPILAANVLYEGKPAFGTNKVFEAPDGTKIGFFGLDTPETATKAHPAKIKGVSFLAGDEMFACAQAQVDELKAAGCELIICVGHLGIDAESTGNRSIDLLEKVNGIDVFIDGHSHSDLAAVKEATNGTGMVGDTLLTSTGTKLANVGAVVIAKDGIATLNLPTEDMTASDQAIADRAAAIAAEIEADYGTVFATSAVELNGAKAPGNRTEETNLGDLITDALVWGATQAGEQVDAAVTNGGGIRATINAGEVTKKDINTVLPFGNTLNIVKVTGAELLEALEASTYCTPEAIGGFPQVSGIDFTVNTTVAYDQGELYPASTYYAPASIGRVTIASVGGKAFDPAATYTIATNDFMASGGDTYYAFAAASVNYDLGVPMDEVVMNYITNELGGVISADKYGKSAGRITVNYADVNATDWYAAAAGYVTDAGIMSGIGNGKFAATNTVTRGTIYQILYNLEGKPTAAASVADVAGKWYADSVNWAASVKLFKDAAFGADGVITRAELAQIIADYAAYKGITVDTAGMAMREAPDYESIPENFLSGMTFCYYGGLMKGDQKGNLNPTGSLTRAELAQVMLNFSKLTPAVVVEPKEVSAKIIEVGKYGNADLDITQADFRAAGYATGDLVNVTVGGKTVIVPVGTAFSDVDQNTAICMMMEGHDPLMLAVNRGSFAEVYGVKVGDTVTITMNERGGYLDEYELHNIDAKRTNVRADYASDEVFANFRPITIGDIAEGVLYRSSSPINPELGRASTADKLAEAAGVNTFINLADSEEVLKGYIADTENFASPYYAAAFKDGDVIALDMGVDVYADEFKAKMQDGIEFMLSHEGPYLFHCTEGKDRAGFMAILLESLMGGTVQEIKDDYMTSFVNYYHVEKGSEQYEKIAASNVLTDLAKLAGLEKGADLSKVDLEKAATDYLISCGLTQKQVDSLQTLLSTPVSAEKAA